MESGNVWVGVSMARWQGSGLSQTIVPVVDTAIGLTPRVQLGASVPRVAGGLGTMFFSTKVAVFSDDVRALKVAVGPTLEVLTDATCPGKGAWSGAFRSARRSIAGALGSTAARAISRRESGTLERASAGR